MTQNGGGKIEKEIEIKDAKTININFKLDLSLKDIPPEVYEHLMENFRKLSGKHE
jgi:hypothetical protein